MQHPPHTLLEHTLWHPVAADGQLGAHPLAVTLLDQPLVLWRDHAGVPHAWADRCPHRGARLSLGQVATAPCGTRTLACPCHGWQFGSSGRCTLVPAQPTWEPPASHAATVYAVTQRHGLLWVRLAAPAASLPAALQHPPAFEAANQPGWRFVLTAPYAVATSAPRLVENFLDMAHFGFVHAGLLGDASHAQVDVGQVAETADGLYAHHCQAWQPQGYAAAATAEAAPAGEPTGTEVAYRYIVPAPYAALLHKDAVQPGGPSNAIALFINPVGHEQCVAWFAMATHADPSTDGELLAFQDAEIAQDRPVVESQQPVRLPIQRPAAVPPYPPAHAGHRGVSPPGGLGTCPPEVHGPTDRLSAAYRRYLLRLGVTVGVC